MKNIIIDLDGTLTKDLVVPYHDKPVRTDVVKRLQEYRTMGFHITIQTSRGMRSCDGDIGKINIEILPDILKWLNRHGIPYDSVVVGKPWCGFDGFYVDDKAIRPSEFASMSYEEIQEILRQEATIKTDKNI